MPSFALIAVLLTGSDRLPAGDSGGGFHRLAPHAWAWISTDEGSANGALLVGDSIALVVDPGLTPVHAERMLAAAHRLADHPIRYVVLTHWHPDHALGTVCRPADGYTVVAQSQAGKALAERAATVARAIGGRARTEAERTALAGCRPVAPGRTVTDRARFDLGGRTVTVVHPGPAHTDGDLVVWEPAERVLVTGDVFMHRASPDMGEAFPLEWARLLDSLVRLRPSAVVAGHFGPSRPADLARFRDYLVALVGRTEKLVDGGLGADSAAARLSMADFADMAQYPAFNATFAANARRVVWELDQRRGKSR